jgi:hypothetical protein
MALLRVDFHLGFSGDDVVVRMRGSEVVRRGVTTREDVAYGGSVEFDVEDGTVPVTVEVPTRGLSGSTEVQVSSEASVVASIVDGELVLDPYSELVGHL